MDWLMEEKFLRSVRVLSESFIIISEIQRDHYLGENNDRQSEEEA
jgi:hypothetical protein